MSKKEESLEEKAQKALESLKEQQKQAQVTWDRCQGAIEVLETLLGK